MSHYLVILYPLPLSSTFYFFFNDTATTEIYTLSLHDALPICGAVDADEAAAPLDEAEQGLPSLWPERKDRKSTRLNSSHITISYAVFCLKKKKKKKTKSRSHIIREVYVI